MESLFEPTRRNGSGGAINEAVGLIRDFLGVTVPRKSVVLVVQQGEAIHQDSCHIGALKNPVCGVT